MIPFKMSSLFVIATLIAMGVSAGEPIVIADFEGTNYGDWKATGEAFGPGPARGTLPGQMPVDGFEGKGLVNSFYNGDKSTGTLTSPPFKIEQKFITFLIGGGNISNQIYMNLLVDGKPVRHAVGQQDMSGGNEMLSPESWDVSELVGKTAIIQIADQATGGWGHINVDQIVQTDVKPPEIVKNAERKFEIEKQYLNFPIKNGAPKRVVTTLMDGQVEVKNEMGLADGKPDWWAPMNVSAWHGKTVTIQVDKLPENSMALSSIKESNTIVNAENIYHEGLRGQFHFSSKRGWNNDPNGLVYYNGEYHLFYQHNPYGWSWGNMHWGHAVSRDLVHWDEIGDVMAPDQLGPMFSGSAVVDWNNTSGLGKAGKPPLVLIYTAAGNPTVQCIASSTDGRTFTKFAGNPVVNQITEGNRDPKVIWFEPTKEWVMVLYVTLQGNKHSVHFLTSPDLRNWSLASISEGGIGENSFLAECPNFFELALDGDSSKKKWILAGANSEYEIGTFDGTKFSPETPKLPGQRGKGFYAPQIFSDIPSKDGRCIQIGWFQTETRGMPFNQSMTIPMELKLISTSEGPRLARSPVKELEALRAKSHDLGAMKLEPDSANPLAGIQSGLVELRANFEPDNASKVIFNIRGATVIYDAKKQEVVVNGLVAPAPLRRGQEQLTIFCDRTGLEVFAGDGLTYVPMPFQANADDLALGVKVIGGEVRMTSLNAYELKSAWPNL